MATRIETILIDDFDGGIADETLIFGLDGTDYVIDLSRANATALREKLAEFTAAARKTKTPARPGSKRDPRNPLIRTWAQKNGYSIKDRGLIPGNIFAAYEAAQN